MRTPSNMVLPIPLGLLAACLGAASAAQVPPGSEATKAQWVTPPVDAPRLQHRVFSSAAAKSKISFHVYTPELYDQDKTRRFPVIYWLHGHGGGLRGLPKLVRYFDHAIGIGKMPPALIVFPNGLAESMWCDSKDGRIPMETIVVKELVPYIDATFRTIASREGRLVEGFSMGGYGAARLGLKYRDVFGAASICGAGPMQREFTPSAGPPRMAQARARILQNIYGGGQDCFKAQSPWTLAAQCADAVRGRLRLRLVVGAQDAMRGPNEDFSKHLTRLKIPHSFRVVPDVGHNPLALFDALGDDAWAFYRQVFGHVAPPLAKSEPKTYFLIVGKGKVADPVSQQQRGAVAVRKVADAARKSGTNIIVDALAESVMTKQQFWQGLVKEKVTGEIFKERLRRLAATVTPQDTVVIYTHSHGRINGFEDSQPLGGIVMDLPIRQPQHGGTLLWDEYVKLLLAIPAKNVVVLTMSCFSGGLVEYLNSPEVRKQWEDRRKKEGRNLIVLTSQNKDRPSDPILKDGEVINPFTYAVVKMLEGHADGFQLVDGKPAEPRHRDGKLTIGEMIDFVLYTTEYTKSEHPRRKNMAKPQVTGSFRREDVLSFGAAAVAEGRDVTNTSR